MKVVTPTRRAAWHEAYDAQMELWRWLRGPRGREYMARNYAENAYALQASSRELLADLYGAEEAKILGASPIFVSTEMCEVVAAASPDFQPEALLPTDLLSPNAFLYYEQPFKIPDRFAEEVTIRAISWTPIIGGDLGDDPARVEDFEARWRGNLAEERNPGGIAITLYADSELGPPDPFLVPIHFTPWYFGMSFEGNEIDENGRETGAAWWWKIVQTTLRLMQQQLAARYSERPDRANRREGAKRGFEDRDVVVVRLRRKKGPASGEPQGEANYSYQFIVGGHWRNQWYPASGVHRQIYISPYVKGPEDAPLVVRPGRVFTWNR